MPVSKRANPVDAERAPGSGSLQRRVSARLQIHTIWPWPGSQRAQFLPPPSKHGATSLLGIPPDALIDKCSMRSYENATGVNPQAVVAKHGGVDTAWYMPCAYYFGLHTYHGQEWGIEFRRLYILTLPPQIALNSRNNYGNRMGTLLFLFSIDFRLCHLHVSLFQLPQPSPFRLAALASLSLFFSPLNLSCSSPPALLVSATSAFFPFGQLPALHPSSFFALSPPALFFRKRKIKRLPAVPFPSWILFIIRRNSNQSIVPSRLSSISSNAASNSSSF